MIRARKRQPEGDKNKIMIMIRVIRGYVHVRDRGADHYDEGGRRKMIR